MPETTCSKCGQPMQDDECPHCLAATAIAKPEHAAEAKVTPPAASDGAFIQGLHTLDRDPQPPADDDSTPSIVREYHDSFLRICVYYLLLAIAFITCVAFWFMFGL